MTGHRPAKLVDALHSDTVVLEVVTVVSLSAACLIAGGLLGFALGRLSAGGDEPDDENTDTEE